MRLLIVRLSSLGDIVHSLPLAENAGLAGAEVAWLVDRQYAGLLEGNPFVTRLFAADTRLWRRHPLSPAVWRDLLALRRDVRGFAPEKTIEVAGLWKSAALARLAGAPTIGFDARTRREPASAILLEEGVSFDPSAVHVVDQNLSLLAPLGIRVVSRAPDARYLLGRERADADAFVARLPRPYALYHPGSSRPGKSWGEENYAGLAARLSGARGIFPVISWGPGDEARAERLEKLLPQAARIPLLDFAGLARVAASSSLFVGGDTGPLHLADALGVPSLALFGAKTGRRNVPQRNGPYRGTALSYDQAASVETVARTAAKLARLR